MFYGSNNLKKHAFQFQHILNIKNTWSVSFFSKFTCISNVYGTAISIFTKLSKLSLFTSWHIALWTMPMAHCCKEIPASHVLTTSLPPSRHCHHPDISTIVIATIQTFRTLAFFQTQRPYAWVIKRKQRLRYTVLKLSKY